MYIHRISLANYPYPYLFKQGRYYPYPIRISVRIADIRNISIRMYTYPRISAACLSFCPLARKLQHPQKQISHHLKRYSFRP